MKISPIKPNLAFTILAFCLALFSVGCDCDGPSDVDDVTKISAQELPPEVIPGPQPQYRVIIKVEFNKDINPASLTAPGGINVSAKGDSGNEDKNIPGTVQYVASAKTAYFISTNPLGFSPGPGENITYTVQVVGNGNNCVERTSSDCIDGCDDDSNPGGNHTRKFTVIG